MDAKEILKNRLEELIDEKLDTNHKLNIVSQCKEMKIPYQTFQHYLKAERECRADNLVRIADYYDVSIDYLLGRTDTRSTNVTIQEICKQTGLTQSAVEKLAEWISENNQRKKWAAYVSFYITSPDYEEALKHISFAKGYNKIRKKYIKSEQQEDAEDAKESIIAQLWYISKNIEVTTEKLIEEE